MSMSDALPETRWAASGETGDVQASVAPAVPRVPAWVIGLVLPLTLALGWEAAVAAALLPR